MRKAVRPAGQCAWEVNNYICISLKQTPDEETADSGVCIFCLYEF